MSQIKESISSLVAHERTPLVLTIVSCTGVVATAFMVARAAPKASRILDEVRAERLQDRLPVEVVLKHTWKLYLPAVGVGLMTIGSIVVMNRVNERNALALSAGAALATNTLKEYQHHILEEIGAEKESKVRNRIAKSQLAANDTDLSQLIISGGGDIACFDSLSGRYFWSDINAIREIENDLNKEILSEMAISLNDLYVSMGLETIDLGYILGFNTDNMIDFHFSSQLNSQNKPVLVLNYINMPVLNYDK